VVSDRPDKPIIVQKFGGTTISDVDTFPDIERAIKHRLDEGYKIIAVVSAMGRGPDTEDPEKSNPYATDSLLSLLPEDEFVCLREKDLLMMCGEVISAIALSCHLRKAGITSRARTGFEAGILTDGNSSKARIQTIDPTRLFNDLCLMDVVVVAGFQGISSDGKITTLGRGGSDTTAVALGHAVNAELIEILTDQDGIFSADPRDVPDAIQLKTLHARDIVHMSWAGAKILDPRAAELIDKYKLNVHVGNIHQLDKATAIEISDEFESSMLVTAVAHAVDVTQFSVTRQSDTDQSQLLKIFTSVTNAGISMDMFTVTENLVRFTVNRDQADIVRRILSNARFSVTVQEPCQKVSIVGAGMHGISGVMARFTRALVENGIQILQTVDSHATISALVNSTDAKIAQQVIHREFINNPD